jgi:hypothetical protein
MKSSAGCLVGCAARVNAKISAAMIENAAIVFITA